MVLKPTTYGIILQTERFDDCVAFYEDKLGLPVWFKKNDLACFRFGGGYLMVETDGLAMDRRKRANENPTTLRFNVEDVASSAALLRQREIQVEVRSFPWGIVGLFADPDGNCCELKNSDDPFFS